MSLLGTRGLAPLAVRLRPRSLDELVGQRQALGPGTPLRRLLEGDPSAAVSVILWGPPGTGKTTLASLVAGAGGKRFVELSAISSGVKDVREVIEEAKDSARGGTVLFIDEVHRFNKTQQDALLPAVENGWVTLIAATTENPSFSVNSPLLSRSVVVRLESLAAEDVSLLLDRALASEIGLAGEFQLVDEARQQLLLLCGGDARSALTLLDAAAGIAQAQGSSLIEVDAISQAASSAVVNYDRDGDAHYDVTSAFIKSMRGSHVDAALHYLARMIVAGEDPRFIARRIVILASEDIGMADPSALQTAMAAMQAVAQIGMPEAGLTLAHAVVHCSLAPKSNAVTAALSRAMNDVQQGRGRQVPAPLRDSHYAGAKAMGNGIGYMYPHDHPSGIVPFNYLPEDLAAARYYEPSSHGMEARWAAVFEQVQTTLKGGSLGSPTDTAADSATNSA